MYYNVYFIVIDLTAFKVMPGVKKEAIIKHIPFFQEPEFLMKGGPGACFDNFNLVLY